jgi:hypothetical protein
MTIGHLASISLSLLPMKIIRKENSFYLRGVYLIKPIYDDRTADTTDKPPNSAKKVGLDVGRNPVVAAGGGAGSFELSPMDAPRFYEC